jgi:hypothetical protein
MTTLIRRSDRSVSEFRVPLEGQVPGSPFGTGELVIDAFTDSDRPGRVALRFYPTAFEFMALLPKLAAALGKPDAVFDWGEAAQTARPVVEYEGAPALLARLPKKLSTLEEMAAFVATGPALFDWQEYQLASVSFEGQS